MIGITIWVSDQTEIQAASRSAVHNLSGSGADSSDLKNDDCVSYGADGEDLALLEDLDHSEDQGDHEIIPSRLSPLQA